MEREDGATNDETDKLRRSAVMSRLAKIYTGTTVVFWPFTDLAMRFFVALPFLRSGIVKAGDWDTALLLATEEYPVSWMAPQHAAALGLTIELVAPILLIFGFLTRPAAFALAALTIVAQAVYIPTTTNLMLIAMLIWFVGFGPAAISIDHWWATRLDKAKHRLVGFLIRIGEWCRRNLAPILMLIMRVWLGTSLLALAEVFEPSIALATWLPITSFTGLPDWVAVLFAVLLFIGAAASPVSYILTFVVAAFMIAGVHPDVTFYPVLLLGLYDARGAGPISVDQFVEAWLRRRFPAASAPSGDPDDWLGTLCEWRDDARGYFEKRRARKQAEIG